MIESHIDRRYRFVIVGLILWANFAFGLSFVSVAPILPIITEDYGISHTMAGLLVSVVFIIMAIFGLAGGIIVGRLGTRRSLTIGLFMMGLVTLTALSPGFEGLIAIRVLYSLGLALMIPATAPLIMGWFRPEVLPMVYGLGSAFVVVGTVVSVATVAPLSDILGWERVLGIFGAVGLGVAFAWLFWGKVQEGVGDVGNLPAAPSLPWKEVRAVLGNRMILLLITADVACFVQFFALNAWLPTFYNETRGWSLTQGGFVISLLPFVGMFAILLGGVLPTKIGSKRLLLIVPGVMVGLGGLGSFLIGDTTITYLSVIILGVGSYIFIPMVNTTPMELPGMTSQRIAIVWGWLMTLSGIGIFVAPLAVGAIRDSFGTFIPGFLIFNVVGWWLFFSGFLLPKTSPQDAQVPEPAPSASSVQEEPTG